MPMATPRRPRKDQNTMPFYPSPCAAPVRALRAVPAILVAAAGLLSCAAMASAEPFSAAPESELPQVRFNHLDWELACDNTRTCRAAGYQADDGDNPPVSVLLQRKAGPGEPIVAELRLGDADDTALLPPLLAMRIDGRSLGTVVMERTEPSSTLSRTQAAALVKAVAGSGRVTWQGAGQTWTLSSRGAAAVLLKMDEFQGRLGTRGAAIRKGTRPDDDVLPPLPALAVKPARVPHGEVRPLGRDAERRLLAMLRKSVGSEDCADLAQIASGENAFFFAPLARDKMLVGARCWRGAYNEGYGYWVVSSSAPFTAALVTLLGSDYENGVIQAIHRGRGIGDCYASDTWVWDGKRFVHAESLTTGMCRGITAGGAWVLPTIVSDVKR
jgi:invasion protein IalB